MSSNLTCNATESALLEQIKITNALGDIYFAIFYLDIINDSYKVIQLGDRFSNSKFIDTKGNIDEKIKNALRRKLSSEDAKRIELQFSSNYMAEHLSSENKSYDSEYSYMISDKTLYGRISAILVDTDSDGKVHHVLLTLQDITEQKTSRIKENAEKEKFKSFIDALSKVNIGEYYIDLIDDTYYSFKPSTDFNLQVPKTGSFSSLVTEYANQYIGEEFRDELLKKFSITYINHYLNDNNEIEFDFNRKIKGKDYWFRLSTILIDRTDTGDIHHIIATAKDITQIVSESEKTKLALREAFENAKIANMAKTDFLSRMSHDVRTPINAIVGMTTIATMNIKNPDVVTDCLNKINISTTHLLSLINDVLDMSKIEAGKITISDDKFLISDLVDNLIEMQKTEAKAKQLTLNVNLENIPHERVFGDSLRIQQAFLNILSNSIKYTPEYGHINVTVSEHPFKKKGYGLFEFVFEDDGIGIDSKFLENIFDPFSRADDEAVRKIQGTGLGMAITSSIIKTLGGTIRVESTLGKGSKFIVNLILKLQNGNISVSDKIKNLPVLIISDLKTEQNVDSILLNNIGLSADVAASDEAVQKLIGADAENKHYFAVILECKKDNQQCRKTVCNIKKAKVSNPPFIIFSSYEWSEIEAEARTAGIDFFIRKPLSKTKLSALFENIISINPLEERMINPLDLRFLDYTGKHILLVEDNELNREIATKIIGVTKATIDTAFDGKSAVEMVKVSSEDYYDLILMDIQMPVMNGLEATSAIRALKRKDAKKIPIVAMTANAFIEDVEASKKAGMNAHLAKPLNIDDLYKVLTKWL